MVESVPVNFPIGVLIPSIMYDSIFLKYNQTNNCLLAHMLANFCRKHKRIAIPDVNISLRYRYILPHGHNKKEADTNASASNYNFL